jgi:hypothetical protein
MAARKKTVRKRTRKRATKAKPRAKRRASKAKASRARRSGARAKPVRKRAGAAPRVRRVERGRVQPAAGRSRVSRAAESASAPGAREATPTAAALAVLASVPVRAGVVRHAFARAGAALIALEAPLAVGDRIHVRGVNSDFLAEVTSLRVGGAPVARAGAGEASLALPSRARAGDIVYALRAPA